MTYTSPVFGLAFIAGLLAMPVLLAALGLHSPSDPTARTAAVAIPVDPALDPASRLPAPPRMQDLTLTE